jgi:hypothetical protein
LLAIDSSHVVHQRCKRSLIRIERVLRQRKQEFNRLAVGTDYSWISLRVTLNPGGT